MRKTLTIITLIIAFGFGKIYAQNSSGFYIKTSITDWLFGDWVTTTFAPNIVLEKDINPQFAVGTGIGTILKGNIDRRIGISVSNVFGILVKPYVNYYIYSNNDDFAFYSQFNILERYTNLNLKSNNLNVKSNDLATHLAVGIKLTSFKQFTLDAVGGIGVGYYYSKTNENVIQHITTHNKNGIIYEGGKGFYRSWYIDLKLGKKINIGKK